jgi:hypothetical protein
MEKAFKWSLEQWLFVINTPKQLWGIEVKSGKPKSIKGLSAFSKEYPDAKTMIIGTDGIPLEDFSGAILMISFKRQKLKSV